jgi:hypothetical protein
MWFSSPALQKQNKTNKQRKNPNIVSGLVLANSVSLLFGAVTVARQLQ